MNVTYLFILMYLLKSYKLYCSFYCVLLSTAVKSSLHLALASMHREWGLEGRPHLSYPFPSLTGETLLSPLVMCGPHGLKFLKPVELRLPHCASMTPDGWSFALKSSDSSSGMLSSLCPLGLWVLSLIDAWALGAPHAVCGQVFTLSLWPCKHHWLFKCICGTCRKYIRNRGNLSPF